MRLKLRPYSRQVDRFNVGYENHRVRVAHAHAGDFPVLAIHLRAAPIVVMRWFRFRSDGTGAGRSSFAGDMRREPRTRVM